jgi:hypothetical protein
MRPVQTNGPDRSPANDRSRASLLKLPCHPVKITSACKRRRTGRIELDHAIAFLHRLVETAKLTQNFGTELDSWLIFWLQLQSAIDVRECILVAAEVVVHLSPPVKALRGIEVPPQVRGPCPAAPHRLVFD